MNFIFGLVIAAISIGAIVLPITILYPYISVKIVYSVINSTSFILHALYWYSTTPETKYILLGKIPNINLVLKCFLLIFRWFYPILMNIVIWYPYVTHLLDNNESLYLLNVNLVFFIATILLGFHSLFISTIFAMNDKWKSRSLI